MDEGTHNDLPGVVIGPSVQAGAIHGGVHVGKARHSAVLPRQLPAVPLRLVNRRAELALLDGMAEAERPALVVLTGPGGIGKTALAVHWATRVLDRFADGQLFADLGGFGAGPPVDPAAVLPVFLRALGVAPKRVPVQLAELVAMYRSLTSTRSLLVLLDNACSAAQVRTLLPASTAAVTLVTSRSRLADLAPDGARTVEVDPLTVEDAVELLTRQVGAERIGAERAQAERIARVCAGLPIALCVAGARLVDRPRLSVGRLAAELADETRRLDALSAPEGPSLRAAFDGSYRSLEPGAAALYRRLALHPGPEFGPGPVAALVHAFPDGPGPAGIESLLRASLVQEVGEERFRFHDLLALHARQKASADDTRTDRRRALVAIFEWYLAAASRADTVLTPYRPRLAYRPSAEPVRLPEFSGRADALAWLERERENVLAAGRAALADGHAELAWHISDVLWPLFLYRKHYRDRLESDHRGVESARAWGNGWAEARMLKRLGRVYTSIGDSSRAERYARMAIARYTELDDTPGRIEAEEVLAALYAETGRPSRAEELLTRTLLANRGLGDPRRVGLTLLSLGALLAREGRLSAGIGLLREAREVFAGLPQPDPYNEVRASIGLARALVGAGYLEDAERVAAAAGQLMHHLGSDYERAGALDLLGQIAYRRGGLHAARRHWSEALEIFEALDSSHADAVRRQLQRLPA